MERHPPTPSPVNCTRTALFAALIVALSGCDMHPASPPPTTAGDAVPGHVTICLPASAATAAVHVDRDTAGRMIASGARLAGGATYDGACRPLPSRVACPCYSATDLATPVNGGPPAPFLYFDALDWYGQDDRRTEIQSVVHVNGGTTHTVAAVYLSRSVDGEPMPYCHYRGYRPGPSPGSAVFVSTTRGVSIPQAEICRRAIDAFAGDFPCQGPACGLPYAPADVR